MRSFYAVSIQNGKEKKLWQQKKLKFIRPPRDPTARWRKSFFRRKGTKFAEYDVTKDRAALDEMVKISGAGACRWSACNEVMVGFERTRLEQMLGCIKQRTEV